MWNKCGMSRNKSELKEAIVEIKKLKEDFYKNVFVPGDLYDYNEELAKAGRVADFLELGELFARDALNREESCGAHFREEYQTEEGEPLRNDDKFAYVSAWEYNSDSMPILHKENLDYKFVKMTQRNYK